jgi:hypothetical protein
MGMYSCIAVSPVYNQVRPDADSPNECCFAMHELRVGVLACSALRPEPILNDASRFRTRRSAKPFLDRSRDRRDDIARSITSGSIPIGRIGEEGTSIQAGALLSEDPLSTFGCSHLLFGDVSISSFRDVAVLELTSEWDITYI